MYNLYQVIYWFCVNLGAKDKKGMKLAFTSFTEP